MANEPLAPVGVSYPPPMSEQYHNALNRYVLFSALLLAWNFLGVQIDIKSFFATVNVSLPTPEKLPILLSVLVLYYAYRICIEWTQCDEIRRSYRSSQVDFGITHLIGFTSVVAYGIQTVPPELGQIVIEKAPTILIFLASVLFVPYGRIIQNFISKGFQKGRWYSKTEMGRLLILALFFVLVQSICINFGAAAVLGNEILQKGNNTYPALFMISSGFFLLGYGFHEIPFSRLRRS